MPLSNGDFSDGDAGYPDIWGFSSTTSIVDFPWFSETGNPVGYEGFLNSWQVDGLDLITAFAGLYTDLTPATYTLALLTYESFEEGWGAYAFFFILTSELAAFDTALTSEDYEDFSDGWGDYWWAMPSTTIAVFDNTWTPEPYEDFEDGFAGAVAQTLKLSFTGGDLTYAIFDGAPYEDFEDIAGWDTLIL